MSFTLTCNPERTSLKTASIYLTPSKRRRLSPPAQLAKTHSTKELWSWTFKKESLVICSIQDALYMKENTLENCDFFWLGSVPCRSVKVVGMVVGVQIYEKRIIYTVDDGTSVIDCSHTQHVAKAVLASESKYKIQKLEPPSSLIPLVGVGKLVRIVGRVRTVHDSRQVIVDEIEPCFSPNDELIHLKSVRQLHRTTYSKMEPFIIPQPSFCSPIKENSLPTPVMLSSPPSSVCSSPIKPQSPVKQPLLNPSLIKLRHPSRIHTHDLTENTFRIYLKHYMDNAPITDGSGYNSDASISHSLAQTPSTPTKQSRTDDTPRQRSYHEITPRRPQIEPLNLGNVGPKVPTSTYSMSTRHFDIGPQPTRKGFTLSYLRRVPELSLLASRVVEAVSRRRLRIEKKKLKEAGMLSSRDQKARASSSTSIPPGKFAAKMKRLFQWAIVELLKEGCIVLWDGPVRRCPTNTSIQNASRLWKANATTSTIGGNSTLFSTTSGSMPSIASELADFDDEGALSDPAPDEEGYLPLTPEYLAGFVENAIKVLVAHYEEMGKPYAGATKQGIVSVLRKDDQWKYVGDWTVDDALEFLKQQGKVWPLGKGRWDLTE